MWKYTFFRNYGLILRAVFSKHHLKILPYSVAQQNKNYNAQKRYKKKIQFSGCILENN